MGGKPANGPVSPTVPCIQNHRNSRNNSLERESITPADLRLESVTALEWELLRARRGSGRTFLWHVGFGKEIFFVRVKVDRSEMTKDACLFSKLDCWAVPNTPYVIFIRMRN